MGKVRSNGGTYGDTEKKDQVPQPNNLQLYDKNEKPIGTNFILIHSAEPTNEA